MTSGTVPAQRSHRVADLPLRIGELPPGPTDSVHDVPGFGLGHSTLWRDGPGDAAVRTGVSVLDAGGSAFTSPVPAGGAVLNGAGEMTGLLTAREWGLVETPVFLTATMSLGIVYDAACRLMWAEEPDVGASEVVIPVVAECDDSFLSDPRAVHLDVGHVAHAWEAARDAAGSGTPPALGAVGAGTGMSALGWKGGIGSASRMLPDGSTVGVVVLANFGERGRLTVGGVPVGRSFPPDPNPRAPAGSCIAVAVTDGPLDAAACTRLARRCGLGLARTGSTGYHGSGEVFLAMATGLRVERGQVPARAVLGGSDLDPYFAGAVEATEAAVLSALLAAPTVTGREGRTVPALPWPELLSALGGTHRS